MNDNLILNNYLFVLKSTVEVYVHGTLEASNKDIKELLKTCLNNTLDHQKDCYNEMVKRGYYEVCNINTSEIKKTYNKCKKN